MNYDAYSDFVRRDNEQARELARRPICSECEEPIQDEFLYEINGEYICPDCMAEHRKLVDDFV